MEDWMKDVKYVLMSSRRPVKGFEKEYQAAYQVWRAAWEKFRAEIGITEPLSSDGFLLAEEIGAVFYKGECIGLSGFTHGTLDDGPLADLGWFKSWTPDAFRDLSKISINAIVCSQFTVNPQFTGKGHIVRWKEIVSLYSLLRFETSDADVMAGHLNLSKGMNNASGETFGATVLNPCHAFKFHGAHQEGQLVAYEKKNVIAMKERRNISSLCDDLWTRLIHVSEFAVNESNVLPMRRAA